MKKLFVVLFVFALLVMGLGFSRGWFAMSRPGADEGSNKINVSLTVDPDKMKEDAGAVKKKAAELTGQGKEGVNELGDQASDSK